MYSFVLFFSVFSLWIWLVGCHYCYSPFRSPIGVRGGGGVLLYCFVFPFDPVNYGFGVYFPSHLLLECIMVGISWEYVLPFSFSFSFSPFFCPGGGGGREQQHAATRAYVQHCIRASVVGGGALANVLFHI
ncbi:hypothetical protein HOY80DRAFT_677982 [Tuber brumale]|nr:hypothetical protein HOY80DRAFT_677982 [Tuber brumale]